MSFVSFESTGRATYGVWLSDAQWLQVPEAFQAAHPDLKSAIAAGKLDELAAACRQSGKAVQASQARLLPVIANPDKIFCVGLNYKTHVAETKRADSQYPSIFTRFADTLSAHGAPLPHPKDTQRFDFEGELAVIIGKGGRYIAQANAFNHIAGYACFNDATARDWQRHTHQCRCAAIPGMRHRDWIAIPSTKRWYRSPPSFEDGITYDTTIVKRLPSPPATRGHC